MGGPSGRGDGGVIEVGGGGGIASRELEEIQKSQGCDWLPVCTGNQPSRTFSQNR